MRLFDNDWFRWFTGAFLFGASIVALAKATDKFKDLKIESASGRFAFSDNSAWLVLTLVLGTVSGLLGLGTAALAKLARRPLA